MLRRERLPTLGRPTKGTGVMLIKVPRLAMSVSHSAMREDILLIQNYYSFSCIVV